MKIGLGKMGARLKYGDDSLLSTSGDINLTSRFVRQLLALGHSVHPVGEVARRGDFFATWPGSEFRGIHATHDLDAIIISQGQFDPLYTKENQALWFNYFRNYEGTVIYLQTDPDLPLHFFPDDWAARSGVAEKYSGPYFEYINFETKKWHIVTTSRTVEGFLSYGRSGRYQVKYPALLAQYPDRFHVHSIELHDILAYDAQPIRFEGDRRSKGAYIGGQRRIRPKFISYSEQYACDLFGKWHTKSLVRLRDKFHYLGILPPGQVQSTYAKYEHSLVVGSSGYEQIGMLAARTWETAQAGCMPMIDSGLPQDFAEFVPTVAPETIADVVASMTASERLERAEALWDHMVQRATRDGLTMEKVLRLI